MPNKYSHALVLSNYESRGLISLPRPAAPAPCALSPQSYQLDDHSLNALTPSLEAIPSLTTSSKSSTSSNSNKSVKIPHHASTSSVVTEIYSPRSPPKSPVASDTLLNAVPLRARRVLISSPAPAPAREHPEDAVVPSKHSAARDLFPHVFTKSPSRQMKKKPYARLELAAEEKEILLVEPLRALEERDWPWRERALQTAARSRQKIYSSYDVRAGLEADDKHSRRPNVQRSYSTEHSVQDKCDMSRKESRSTLSSTHIQEVTGFDNHEPLLFKQDPLRSEEKISSNSDVLPWETAEPHNSQLLPHVFREMPVRPPLPPPQSSLSQLVTQTPSSKPANAPEHIQQPPRPISSPYISSPSKQQATNPTTRLSQSQSIDIPASSPTVNQSPYHDIQPEPNQRPSTPDVISLTNPETPLPEELLPFDSPLSSHAASIRSLSPLSFTLDPLPASTPHPNGSSSRSSSPDDAEPPPIRFHRRHPASVLISKLPSVAKRPLSVQVQSNSSGTTAGWGAGNDLLRWRHGERGREKGMERARKEGNRVRKERRGGGENTSVQEK